MAIFGGKRLEVDAAQAEARNRRLAFRPLVRPLCGWAVYAGGGCCGLAAARLDANDAELGREWRGAAARFRLADLARGCLAAADAGRWGRAATPPVLLSAATAAACSAAERCSLRASAAAASAAASDAAASTSARCISALALASARAADI